MNTIRREQKIKMFLYEYYFGFSTFIKLLRFLGGPLILFIGIYFYRQGIDKFSIAYSGFCFFYGIYYILKPYLWVLFRLKSYQSSNIGVTLTDEIIEFTEDESKSELKYSVFERAKFRSWYVTLQMNKSTKVYLPNNILTDEQLTTLKNKLG